MSKRIISLSRFLSRPPPSSTSRYISTGPVAYRGHNLLAKYAIPLKPINRDRSPLLPQGKDELDIADRVGAFETAATTPVGTSLQETPPPDNATGTKLAVQLPAMTPVEEPIAVKAPLPVKDQAMVIEGISIPSKPVPPGEEECCMSGCVHCVYTIYADDLEAYTTALSSAKIALETTGTPKSTWPEVIRNMDDTGKTAGDVQAEAKGKVQEGVDPAMAAFLA